MSNKTDKKMLEEGVINFFGKKEEYRSLSNFSVFEVVIRGVIYESGEHAYHGEKFKVLGEICEDVKRKEELLSYSVKFMKPSLFGFGSDVKSKGGKKVFKLTDVEDRLWKEVGIEVQREICRFKYENYEVVRADLVKSGVKLLVHPAMRCGEEKVKSKLWEGRGIVVDGKIEVIGRNMLGNLWMELR
jgi:predicted NAD-dependent protein-ADP-ribosyltransferase YbiA (DUF1768 family)